MTPQERETRAWKRRLAITEAKGTWTAGNEGGKKQRVEYCALANGKQCHPTKEDALKHLTSLANGGERRGNKISVYRCSWADHYHVGKRR